MTAGIVGRQVTRAQAKKALDLPTFLTMDRLAGIFENKWVRPGSMVLIFSGVTLAVVQGWPILGFLQGAASNWLLVANLFLLGIILIIPFIFIPRGKIFEKVLEEAKAVGEITPALRQAFDDPVVRWAHDYENVALLIIILLMITKPF
jgi:hypothetical protein